MWPFHIHKEYTTLFMNIILCKKIDLPCLLYIKRCIAIPWYETTTKQIST